MDNSNLQSIIGKLYNKIGYFDKYGGSVVSTIFILIVFFVIFSYFNIIANIKPIKKNWNINKCKPGVIPFAGIINKPKNMTAFEFTSTNFMECLNSVQTSITGDFLQPIYYIVNTVKSSLDGITSDIQMVRKKITSVIDNMVSIDSKIMGKIMGFLTPIRLMLIKMKDALSKIMGVGVTTAYSTIGLWLSLQTFIKAFVTIMLDGLYAMVGILVLLWILPFTWELAAAYTAIFGVAAGFIGVVVTGAEDIIGNTRGVPKAPMCFDERTELELLDGSVKNIREIKLNDVLQDGGIVTAFFKVSQNDMDMYSLNNTIVSGNHSVIFNNKWISVSEHPHSIRLFNYNKKYLYCLNTTTKNICINNITFSDWDDIDNDELISLRENLSDKKIEYRNIHNKLDSGFNEESILTLECGKKFRLGDIKIGDNVNLGGEVKGIVYITTHDLDIYNININNNNVKCCKNNIICDNLGNDSNLNLFNKDKLIHKPEYLLHLITENGYIEINNIKFKDYNSSIERYL
tara:strand:+ start:5516 stop:7063 length:1548 start_codon:yes stop_codon:yes gene_type:complete